MHFSNWSEYRACASSTESVESIDDNDIDKLLEAPLMSSNDKAQPYIQSDCRQQVEGGMGGEGSAVIDKLDI